MRAITLVIVVMGVLGVIAADARARADDDRYRGGHEHEWREHEWRERQGRAYLPPRYYALPPAYYAPPGAYYSPYAPPRAYYVNPPIY